MIKKGNKTQYHNMEVPVTSEFANQFKAREEVFAIEFKLSQLHPFKIHFFIFQGGKS